MPSTISLARRVPWLKVWAIATWLLAKGRARLEDNLSEAERSELRRLLISSRGKPTNLSPGQRDRVKSIVKKAAVGR
ncbi:MAG TPA: hypothetical protein VHA54_02860 [Solirubrobacterales bacterium]|nr:hypothetical protein [Solirubrobacterales bacterium]